MPKLLIVITLLFVMTGEVAQAHQTKITASTPGLQIVQLRQQISHDISVMNKKFKVVPVHSFNSWIQIVQVTINQEEVDYHKAHYKWATHKLVKLWSLLGNVGNWTCIHNGEASWNDSGDPYWGGLQMDTNFQKTYGSDMISKYHGYANVWHPYDQMIVAERAHDRGRGYYPWPTTARGCGLIND